ncbi:hypothetical protein ILYODFUR_038083, partial [Ilyodon furcidens]
SSPVKLESSSPFRQSDAHSCLIFSMASAKTEREAPFSLDTYYVSEKLGFVLPDPLENLPSYYQPWMDIALRLPELLHSHELRSHVNKMPLLSTRFLKDHRELRLAHLVLSMITMGYVWQEDAAKEPCCSLLGGVTVLRASPNSHPCRCSIS